MGFARISLVLGAGILLVFSLGFSRPQTAEDKIMSAFGLKSGELITIDQVSKSEIAIEIDGQDYMIDYVIFSNRSRNFKLMIQGADGELVEQAAPPVNTIRGSLRGVEGSRVVGCVDREGCCAKISFHSGEDYYIEPVNRRFDFPAFAGSHVVYSKDEVIPTGGQCGTVTKLIDEVEEDVPAVAYGGSLEVLEIALDADFEYFSLFGSTLDTLAQMELIFNIVNDQYESEVGIRHAISDAIVRTTSSDPYTTSDSDELLDQLRDFYVTGEGNGTISGDLCFLFTGRNLDGNTIGLAFIGVVCNPEFGFGLAEDIFTLSSMTDLVAHELGHNWNQDHCTCPNHTMNPTITGANDFNDTITVPNLIAYRNSRTCLDLITPGGFGPNGRTNNDDWFNEIFIADPNFSVTGSNFNATTQEDEQNLVNVGSTTWWFVDADTDGRITIDTFSSDFDTQLQVYEFVPGAGFAGLVLVDGGSSDDANGTRQSQVTFDVTAGTCYEIRVGGWRSFNSIGSGSEGNIVLNSSFTPIIDLGVVGPAGSYAFDTEGSGFDTELGIWDANEILLDSDDDGGNGTLSLINIDLAEGVYFLGISEFDSIFEDGLVNSGTAFEAGEIETGILNINGALGGTITIGESAGLSETAFFRIEVQGQFTGPPAVDLGVVGPSAAYTFDTNGSGFISELGIWDAEGNLLDSNKFGGANFNSSITINLAQGVYFLGVSEFDSVFEDGFVNSGEAFEPGEIETATLNINGDLGGTITIGDATGLDETGFFRVEVQGQVLLGDVNQDSEVNFFDISPFITVLSAQSFQFEADLNQDGIVNFFDIQPFINALSN